MEQVVGIFDGQAEYAKRLVKYINGNKELGCFAVGFSGEEEVFSFCERKKLSALILGSVSAETEKLLEDRLPSGLPVWHLSEEKEEGDGMLFRYQKAGELIRPVAAALQSRKIRRRSDLFTVFSPESNRLAEEHAVFLAEQLAEKGRTLLLFWDPFCVFGRQEQEGGLPTLSELLYYIRKDSGQAKNLFSGIRKKKGVEFFCGADFATDLWQYSSEEMERLLQLCKCYGKYEHIVVLAGVFHEGILSVMRQSSHVVLVSSKTEKGEQRRQEFFRQMKYAGEQEILSALLETDGER